LGESITEATVAQWYKKPGEAVSADEPLCELETDKVTIEVPAPSAGVMGDVAVVDDATVEVGALLGSVAENGSVSKKSEGVKKSEPLIEEDIEPVRVENNVIKYLEYCGNFLF